MLDGEKVGHFLLMISSVCSGKGTLKGEYFEYWLYYII